jgi:hypothetical protein
MNITEAFNGDNYILEEVKRLIKVFKIRTIFETGTYEGKTTAELAKLGIPVISSEINTTYLQYANSLLSKNPELIKFIKLVSGNSPDVINDNIQEYDWPILFFLDAHWYNYNPLLDELRIISEHRCKTCVIIIHDFKVPDKDFGYDKFPDGSPYEWSKIEKYVDNIYGKGKYKYYYNDKAEGSYRGVVYITPSGE